jgi:hypothetical protein
MSEIAPFVSVLNILILGPLMLYVGLRRPSSEWPYFTLYAAGAIMTAIYIVYIIRDAILKRFSESPVSLTLKFVHACLVGPLMVYIGIVAIHMNGYLEIPPIAMTFLVLAGIGTTAVHIAFLIRHFVVDFKPNQK